MGKFVWCVRKKKRGSQGPEREGFKGYSKGSQGIDCLSTSPPTKGKR